MLLRQAVIDHDILALGLGSSGAFFYSPPQQRLSQFNTWFAAEGRRTLAGPWFNEWLDKATHSGVARAVGEINATNLPEHRHDSHLYELAYGELVGIAAAVAQQVQRAAADIIARGDKPVVAFKILVAPLDRIGRIRLRAFTNTMTVRLHILVC